MVGENQHGTGVEVQLVQLVVQVVVEKLPRLQDAGVVDDQADVQVVRGVGDDGQEVIRRQIDRDDPGFDPVPPFEFGRQLRQAVLTPGATARG